MTGMGRPLCHQAGTERRPERKQQEPAGRPFRGLRVTAAACHLLALRVVILDEILQQVHALLGLDLVDFDEILRK